MRGEKDSKRLDALRQRLYERGVPDHEGESDIKKASDIKPETEKLPTDWSKPAPKKPVTPPPISNPEPTINMPSKRRQSMRIKVIVTSLIFFVGAVALSSLFILFGGNTISGDNIAISLNGPFTVGGGEVMNVQVGIVNENNISIESAILVVDYPQGSRAINDDDSTGAELFTERLSLDSLESGESMNIPLKFRVYGEENEDMTLNASVEYRVSGSNSTFYKQSKPLRFKVSTSPVVVSMDSLSSLASGQETDIEIKVISNSNTTQEDLLLRLDYPSGFEFISADPSPDSGRNAWTIDSLEPEETKIITLTGIALGSDTETQVINASVGAPSDRDKYSLSSTLNTTSLEYEIEQPFVTGSIKVGNNSNSPVSISNDSSEAVTVEVVNNLDETIYNGVVTVSLSGSALRYTDISGGAGYYDSNKNTITWDVSSLSGLSEMSPGERETMAFSISPHVGSLQNSQLNIKASFAARRSSPSRVQETLTDSLATEVRISSQANILAGVGHNNGVFSDFGPIPPEVGEETSYTVSMLVESGNNGLGDSVVTAILPTYVIWQDEVKGDGSITYDDSSRKMEWDAGTIGANGQATVSFQVSILPSSSQIGTTPILVGITSLRAIDLYTDDVVTATHAALGTEMSSESGYGLNNGVVTQ